MQSLCYFINNNININERETHIFTQTNYKKYKKIQKIQKIQQRWENIPSLENYPLTNRVTFLLPNIDRHE